MSEVERINAILAARTPALFACLSPLGKSLAFPKGIPFQANEAKATKLNGTIGQVTDGAGSPLPLPVLKEASGTLDAKMAFLYSPQSGHPEVRKLWLARQLALAGRTAGACTLPYATHGLTHSLSIVSELFTDPETTVIIPTPTWENYEFLFTARSGAKVATWPFFKGETFDLDALGATLDGITGKAVLVLNFPSNPTGWSPTPAEAAAIVKRVAAHPHPMVVIVDDAYQGVIHEEGRLDHSLFWMLSEAIDPARTLALKIDGATKELLFFSSRVGFITASFQDAEAEAAFTSKVDALVRATVGGPAGPSQAMMLAALRDHARTTAEFAALRGQLSQRWQALKDALAQVKSDKLQPFPFNSAYFALIGLAPGVDADVVRKRLITERSVGVIALPEVNAIRIAYCSTTAEDVAAIVRHLAEVVESA